MASVIIPAHDESNVVTRLLERLATLERDHVEIVVVCNGCRDDTADKARATGVPTAVIEIPEASKKLALERGDQCATSYPRIYIDADVVIDAASVTALVTALEGGRHLAAGPRREFDFSRSSRLVRWYYDVWQRLPAVRSGLFGRGVIALAQAGAERVHSGPRLMGDDLVASEMFEPVERVIVDSARSIIYPPRTIGDLIRRRARAATGNAQADQHRIRRPESVTSPRTLLGLVRAEPLLAPKLVVFAGVAVAARLIARRAVRSGDFDTWRRDVSSRS